MKDRLINRVYTHNDGWTKYLSAFYRKLSLKAAVQKYVLTSYPPSEATDEVLLTLLVHVRFLQSSPRAINDEFYGLPFVLQSPQHGHPKDGGVPIPILLVSLRLLLYKRVCLSVGPSVRRSVGPAVTLLCPI